ncbi:MAG: hypothetical protein IT581_00270 [Verrucomicrobiales bacterium]|nr:hypothetical protein [Verrucomicrobiales bacterium]
MRSRISHAPCVRFLACPAKTLASLVLLASLVRGAAIDPDLPFSSGSTGADGALTFREIPQGRTAPMMAYDPVRREVVMFGGANSGNSLGDTYVFRGTNWIRLQPPVSPIDRWSGGMAWDAARQEIVLFGGTRSTGRLNDTWTWNGTTWTEKKPESSPGPRDGMGFAYDAARQRVVMFGGNGGGTETWLWDGTRWTQASPLTSPPGSGSSAMAYYAAKQECVFFGNFGQTWAWNGSNWTQKTPFTSPQARNFPTLIQDGTSNTLLLTSGSNLSDTWSWDGTNWFNLTPGLGGQVVPGRQFHAMAWDEQRQYGVLFGGDVSGVDGSSADTWLWKNGQWQFWSGKTQVFDMSVRPGGAWNFTTINVPAGVTVQFKKNSGNTPVRWLATGDVTVDGIIDVSGVLGSAALPPGVSAAGGPGGFDGGRGAIAVNTSGSPVGSPGQGPGGGGPGTSPATSPENLRDGRPGSFAGPTVSYGNAFLQPLLGGSGGGGGSSSDVGDGGHGGGGGGAILISSSRDIVVNGLIRANGGDRQFASASIGGPGSGGAILLRADRVSVPGTLQAFGGNTSNPNGRIRVEAYVRSLTGSRIPAEVVGLPAANGELNAVGTLTIVSVDGVNVVNPPTGNLSSPDVVFSDAGPMQVVVQGTGIPNGTAIRLRVTTANAVIEATPQDLVNGRATFNVTVPKGLGTLQATAQFNAP